ncbi:MAG: HutD family protein [Candidatus Tumulicola sp.]
MRQDINASAVLRSESYRPVAWKNGTGTTDEIAASSAIEPGWRLSLATIDRDGPFSDFTGYDRTIVPIQGNGIELTFDEVDAVLLERRFQAFGFRGERRTWCRILGGPVRDFNVMTRRAAFSHVVDVRPVTEAVTVEPDRLGFVHLLRGSVAGARTGDTIRIGAGGLFATPDAAAGTLLCVVKIARVGKPESKQRHR